MVMFNSYVTLPEGISPPKLESAKRVYAVLRRETLWTNKRVNFECNLSLNRPKYL